MVLKSKMFELAVLFIFMAYGTLSILLGAYSAEDGFINNDSAEYLRLSERLLSGHGFFITTAGRIGQESEILFGVWPIGYPTLIATVAFITGLSSFAASKALNAILMIVAIFSLYKAFGRRGLIASAILLTAGTLKIYTMTWAEGAFITSLILLIIYIINIANNHTKINFYGCIWLLVLTILPFLFRYIGLCVLAPVFMSSCYMYYLGRRSDAIKILLVTIIAGLLCFAYLSINTYFTGHATGTFRYPAPELTYTWFKVLFTAIIHEFILIAPNWSPDFAWVPEIAKEEYTLRFLWVISIFWFLLTFFTTFILFWVLLKKGVLKPNLISIVFLLFGSIYLASIIYARWTTHFNPFFYRSLDPGFTLIFIGMILWLMQQSSYIKKITTSFIAISIITVGVINTHFFYVGYASDLTYTNKIRALQNRYADLPDNARVLFGSHHLRYIKPNHRVVYARVPPYAEQESLDELLSSFKSGTTIYIDKLSLLNDLDRYHSSFRNIIKSFPEKEMFIVKSK